VSRHQVGDEVPCTLCRQVVRHRIGASLGAAAGRLARRPVGREQGREDSGAL